MQFKNPEILYFLLLLIIPILIHLFQLQRFQKIAFTNVKLLKEIKQQTRKSSQLKKILILMTRLLLFTSLIFAFSQPFLTKNNNYNKVKTFIYLDNSFSMQAKGEKGELLQSAKNELIENLKDRTHSITLITNNEIYEDLNSNELKNNLINIDFYPVKKDLYTLLLQINNLKNSKAKSLSDIILISDFQRINSDFYDLILDTTANYTVIQTKPAKVQNISIDSVWLSEENLESIKLKSLIKSQQFEVKNLSISIFINNKLSGKTSITLKDNDSTEIEFIIPNEKNLHGVIRLNDNKLLFDNNLYFSILEKEKKNVLVIGQNNDFLSKIFTQEEFDLKSTNLEQLDYSIFNKQQLIIINEIEFIPNAIVQPLKYFIENEGNIVIIPSSKIEFDTYNNLFSSLQIGNLSRQISGKKTITTINYSHPFFKNVFQNKISNFQYPKVDFSFKANLISSSSILQFEDKIDFISQVNINNNKLYWFASPLNKEISNFTSSPLVVPVFYNFSIKDVGNSQLYYYIGQKNEIIVKTNSKKENVLHLTNAEIDFIPLQNKSTNYIKIQTEDEPLKEGIYQITDTDSSYQNSAYNYSRRESKLTFFDMEEWTKEKLNVKYFTSVERAIKKINNKYKDQNLWQLFIIFAVIFLVLEIILQKVLKI